MQARDQRCRDPEGFCTEVDTLVQKARSSGLRLGQIQAGQLLTCMFSLCLQHEVRVYFLLFRKVSLIEVDISQHTPHVSPLFLQFSNLRAVGSAVPPARQRWSREVYT